MDKIYFEEFMNDKLVPFVNLPDGEKIKPFFYKVTTVTFTRIATPEKCNKFGLKAANVVGGFVTGSMGELDGKFKYRQNYFEVDDTGQTNYKIKFKYLPEADDHGIPVAKVNFQRRINPKWEEHIKNTESNVDLFSKKIYQTELFTDESKGTMFIKIRLEI
jgi:hypothetical protein